MDKIMLTGAGGFFASRFAKFYKDRYNIVALNHSELDICNEQKTIDMIRRISPKYVVHSAAISDTGICERNPELSYNVNVRGSVSIAKGCAVSNAKLIYLSSDQVYNGNIEAGPYDEDIAVMPNTVYGRHKFEAENEVSAIVENTVILRLTWLFSLPERYAKTNSNIIWNIIKCALENKKITLPANEYRGITYVYDLISNFDKILGIPKGIYNTGSENNFSTYETAEAVLNYLGLANRIEDLLIKDEERYKQYPRDLRISNEKLKNFQIYFTSTEEAVRECIHDFSYKII